MGHPIVQASLDLSKRFQSYFWPHYFDTFQNTLKSIFNNIQPKDEPNTLVVVFIADTNHTFISEIANFTKVEFGLQLKSGILDIISPPPEYYPNWSSLKYKNPWGK